MGSHSVTCHSTPMRPILTPGKQAGTGFTYPVGIKNWVDFGG